MSVQINTIGEACQRAYQMLGQLTPPAYTMSDDQLQRGLLVADGVLQAIQTAGINVFRQTPMSVTTTAGVPTVAIPNDVVGIEEARVVIQTNPLFERQLGRFQWADYMMLPTKNAPGSPTVFMFDYQVDSTQFYLWMVSPTPVTINFTGARRAADVIDQFTVVDLPREWHLGYTYMLADALMDDQGMAEMDPATAERIKGHSLYWKQQLEDFDRPTSVFLRPMGYPNSGRFRRRY